MLSSKKLGLANEKSIDEEKNVLLSDELDGSEIWPANCKHCSILTQQ